MIRILAAIDTSQHAETVMRYARFVARIFQGGVLGLCVVESKKIEGPLLRDYLLTVGLDAGLDYKGAVERFLHIKSEELLETFRQGCAAEGIPFEGAVEKGIVPRVVGACAEEADIIILGRKGEHAEWHAAPLGSSVETVIRHTHKPVLITPRRFVEVRRALVAYDGSEHAREALDLAARIHRATGLGGVILHVRPVRDDEGTERLFAEVRERLGADSDAFRFLAHEGEAGTWIPACAVENDCQLIIMGAFGHSRLREKILGSATQQVILGTPDLPLLLRR